MTFSEIGDSLIYLSLSSYSASRSTAGDDLVRSRNEAIFVSLVTRTSLPALPAGVAAEISKMCQKRGGRVTRTEHCRDSCNSRQCLSDKSLPCVRLYYMRTFNVKLNESSQMTPCSILTTCSVTVFTRNCVGPEDFWACATPLEQCVSRDT